MESLLQVGYDLLDKGLIPDFVLRRAIRILLRERLREIDLGSFEANHAAKMKWIQDVKARKTIADVPEKANEQHYEARTETLAEAERLMFESYCEKARLKDGLDILDLGCGWGSLSLFLAEKYPNARIVGLSNSSTQKQHIDATVASRGIKNITIITGDVNTFDFQGPNERKFDRILSIEMFEHMKNYEMLFEKISSWLKPSKTGAKDDEALLFIHIFCHKTTPYHFVEDDGWMAKNFFSGGTMPSHDLFLYFQSNATLIQSWFLPGTHYSRTLEDWLKLQDSNQKAGLRQLENDAVAKGLPASEGAKTFYRFRVFYLACSELFNMDRGQQWGLGHYLFKAKKS